MMRSLKKQLMFIPLLCSLLLLTGCSYITDFAVINESDQPVEVRYKIKNYPGSFSPPVTPATIAASQLSTKGDRQWNKLAPDRFQLDQDNRAVVVRVMPHEALLVADMHNYGGHEATWDAKEFPIVQLTVKGSRGEITFTNDDARRSFSEVSRALYTLTYK